ncbi:MAG: hypothetical protein IPJ71_06120 [Bdellovibrionales bacterium]|nr:hypothetical protein [Bdellovibrionales bacterium]
MGWIVYEALDRSRIGRFAQGIVLVLCIVGENAFWIALGEGVFRGLTSLSPRGSFCGEVVDQGVGKYLFNYNESIGLSALNDLNF